MTVAVRRAGVRTVTVAAHRPTVVAVRAAPTVHLVAEGPQGPPGEPGPPGPPGEGGLDQATADVLYVNTAGDSMPGDLTANGALLGSVYDGNYRGISNGPASTTVPTLLLGSKDGASGLVLLQAGPTGDTGIYLRPGGTTGMADVVVGANDVMVYKPLVLLTEPVAPNHATTRQYVDAATAPLIERVEHLERRIAELEHKGHHRFPFGH